jgi:hypothetical protein
MFAKIDPRNIETPRSKVLLEDEKYGNVYKHITGFADSNIGNVAMVECPKCFYNWFFHSRINEMNGGSYFYFYQYMKNGECLHFKPKNK